MRVSFSLSSLGEAEASRPNHRTLGTCLVSVVAPPGSHRPSPRCDPGARSARLVVTREDAVVVLVVAQVPSVASMIALSGFLQFGAEISRSASGLSTDATSSESKGVTSQEQWIFPSDCRDISRSLVILQAFETNYLAGQLEIQTPGNNQVSNGDSMHAKSPKVSSTGSNPPVV